MHLPYKFKNLSIAVDHEKIANEICALGNPWVRHGFHKTGHDVIPLLSTDGNLLNRDGSFNNSLMPPFLPTPHLGKMPYTKDVIYSFGLQPQRVRVAKMNAGDIISPHRDLHPNWFNKVRVHVPVRTNDKVLFHVWETSNQLSPQQRTEFHMAPGTCWIVDTWRTHAVTNFSDEDRIHLIVDLEPRGRLFSAMFNDVPEQALRDCLSYEYPLKYETDAETLHWLTGGNIDAGVKLWATTLTDKNPQVGRYQHEPEFWR